MLNSDLQKLEPGNRIRLIEVDGTRFGADILRFHCDTLPFTPQELAAAGGDESKLPAKSVWWQGQEYGPWPFSVEGLEISADSQGNAPKLSVANINGLISALCLQFEDMAQAKVRIHDTLVHYLDARNFPQGNSSADPLQEKLQVFYIDRKATESDEAVEFELSSPADLRGCAFRPGKSTACAPGARAATIAPARAAITPVAVTLTTKATRWRTRVKIAAAGC